MAAEVLSGSGSDSGTTTTTEDDSDSTLPQRSRQHLHSPPFMFLDIPFEQQKRLFEEIRSRDVEAVRRIVDESPVSLKWRHFIHSPLGLACCLNNDEMAGFLLRKIESDPRSFRGEVNYRDRKGWTPVMYSALNGNSGLVAKLCAAGARVNCRDHLKWTPLAHACYNGHVDVVRFLLKSSNADPRLGDDGDGDTTVLHCLAKQRAESIFEEVATAAELVLQHDQSIVDLKTGHGKTALHEACRQHNPQLIHVLLKYGSKVNSRDDQCQTPIFYFFHGVPRARRRMSQCLRLILSAPNIRLNLRDAYSLAPIHLATLEGDARAVEMLMEAGADWKFADRSKRWPIHYAARDQQLPILELLLKHEGGNQVNATSWSDISTPLTELLSHCAESHANQKLILGCVKVLLRHGADVSIPNAFLNTPVDLAAESNLWSVSRLLVLAGAYFNVEILQGRLRKMQRRLENRNAAKRKRTTTTTIENNVREDDDDDDEDEIRRSSSSSDDDDDDDETDDDEEVNGGLPSSGLRVLSLNPPGLDEDMQGFQWCVDFLWQRPLPLRDLCRLHTRRTIGKRMRGVIEEPSKLPLPERIVDYLLLKDEIETLF